MSSRAVLPNLLSASRLLVAVYILCCPQSFQLPLLLLAGFTDVIDGYLARRWHATSQIGAILDPLGDKVLASSVTYMLWCDGRLHVPEIIVLFSRDIVLVLFVIVLVSVGRWRQWRIQSFWSGKVATALQMVVFALLCLQVSVSDTVYVVVALTSVLAFCELLYRMKEMSVLEKSMRV